jgi:hypothetical protein
VIWKFKIYNLLNKRSQALILKTKALIDKEVRFIGQVPKTKTLFSINLFFSCK